MFHSVMLLPDNHQEEAQSNGNENETMRSSQEWTNSKIQKYLKYIVALLALKSPDIFMASSGDPFKILTYCYHQIQITQAPLQTEGFPLKFAEDFSKDSFRSVCTLLYSFWAQCYFAVCQHS